MVMFAMLAAHTLMAKVSAVMFRKGARRRQTV